nr:putative reverse transcriptase domain-containing protein [Tanacetum cinerariifolium]
TPLGYRAAEIRMRALLPSTSRRTDIPKADVPPRKRACLTTPALTFEIRESSAVGSTRQQRTDEFKIRFEEAQDDRALLRAQVNTLFRDRPNHRRIAMLMDREEMYAREAWAYSEDRSLAIVAHVRTLETHVALIDRGIAATLVERDANMSKNGDNSNDSGTDGRRQMTTPRECTYNDFLKFQPMSFQGTEGVVGTPLGYRAAEIRMRALLPSTSRRTDILEADVPPWKRACLTTPALGFEIRESSAVGSTRQQRTNEFKIRFEEAQDDRALLRARVNTLFRDRPNHRRIAMLMDREEMYAREAWAYSEDRRIDGRRQMATPRECTYNDFLKFQPMSFQGTEGVVGDKKPYGGTKPLCPKCNYHHDGPCAPKCTNTKKIGHLAHECKGWPAATNNNNNPINNNQRAQGPLPANASLITRSPGYIADSEPIEDDPKEDSEIDPVDYAADNEEEEAYSEDEEEKKEEHLAPSDSALSILDSAFSAEETEPFETDESDATPPPPRSPQTVISLSHTRIRRARIYVRPHTTPSPSTKARIAEYAATPAPSSPSPSPLSPLSSPLPLITSPPLLLPSPTRRDIILEVDMPLRKRARFTAPSQRFEIRESSTAATSRQTRHALARGVDYGFVDTLDASIRATDERVMKALEGVNERMTDLAATHKHDTYGIADTLADYQANGGSGNGHDSHDSRCGGRRTVHTARVCTYKDFLNCQPLNFKGAKGVVGHYKKDCPKLKNKNRGNYVGNGEACGKAYVLGGGEPNTVSNIVTSTFLLNNRYASILFDIGADKSFLSAAFSSLIDIIPTTLDNSYDVDTGALSISPIRDERIVRPTARAFQQRLYKTKFLMIFEDCQTKQTQKKVKFDWGDKEEGAFQLLKKKLCSASILALPEGTKDFVVYCDTSHKGLADVLMQREKLTGSEIVHETTEKIMQIKSKIQVGDKVMLKVSSWKWVIRFGKWGKLNPRYIKPFKTAWPIVVRHESEKTGWPIMVRHVYVKMAWPSMRPEWTYLVKRVSLARRLMGRRDTIHPR